MDDAELVAAARRGDDTAWAAIYDRYADKLHDHCHRILRDRDEAADALHDAFLAAARNLHQLRDPTRLRPWLYSICRHTSLRRLKARSRVELTDAPEDMRAPDPELDRGVRTRELSELVWAAAAGLSGRDQALLDLNLRQGLEGQDLADAMGTSLNNSYVMLSRMRDQVERSLGALLIARMGREDCPTLDAMLKGWDGKFSPLLRKRVARHVDSCEVCSEKRKAVVSPLALLAAAPLVPAPSLLKTRVISSIRNVEVMDGPRVPFTKEGFAVLAPEAGVRRPKAAWLAVAAAVVLIIGGFLLFKGGDGDPIVATGASSTIHPRTKVTAPGEDTTTSLGGETTEGTDDGATGSSTTNPFDQGRPPVTTPTTKPGPTTTAGPTTTKAPALPSISSASATTLSCSGNSQTLNVVVHASNATSVTAAGHALSDSNHNGSWAAQITVPKGTSSIDIVASDGAGHSATSSASVSGSCPTTTTRPTTTSSTNPTPG